MKTRGARYFSNYSAGCRRTAWAGFLGLIYYSTSSTTRTKRNRDFHAIRAISFDGLPAFNLIRTPHPQRASQFEICVRMMWFSNALFACAENPARALPHCWLVKNVAASSIFRRFDARGLRGESRVSNSLRAAVKSSQSAGPARTHTISLLRNTQNPITSPREKEEELSSSTAQPRLLFLIVYWIPMGWKISSWPCHPPRSRRTPVRAPCICIITLIAPSHLPLKQQHQHLSLSLCCVCAAEISLESKRAHKAPFYLHTLRFPIQSVFSSTFLLSPNAHTNIEFKRKTVRWIKREFAFQAFFNSWIAHLKFCSKNIHCSENWHLLSQTNSDACSWILSHSIFLIFLWAQHTVGLWRLSRAFLNFFLHQRRENVSRIKKMLLRARLLESQPLFAEMQGILQASPLSANLFLRPARGGSCQRYQSSSRRSRCHWVFLSKCLWQRQPVHKILWCKWSRRFELLHLHLCHSTANYCQSNARACELRKHPQIGAPHTLKTLSRTRSHHLYTQSPLSERVRRFKQ